MDFSGRGSQPVQPSSTAPQYSNAGSASNSKKTKTGRKQPKWLVWTAGVVGALIIAAFIVLIGIIAVGGNPKLESTYVDNNKLQAVFLQTGQVYFGNVSSMNDKYIVLKNIYYLQTSSTDGSSSSSTSTANTNVSLVKLGCELHAPYDQMLINRDQVTFWENLQDDGQVAKAVSTFEKDNPDGQKCSDQSSAPNSSSSVQGSSTSNTTNSSTTSNTTKQ